jgi:ketosteroid isomerase-like protein
MTEVQQSKAEAMKNRITVYFDGCNEADIEKMSSQFTPDAVHFFPPGLNGPWRGATTIAENWRRLVMTVGSAWTIERMIVDPDEDAAVIEWTHWKTKDGVALRGDEWYKFDPESGLITEIRAFYAAPADSRSHIAIEGFDYAAENYHLAPTVERPHPEATYTTEDSTR